MARDLGVTVLVRSPRGIVCTEDIRAAGYWKLIGGRTWRTTVDWRALAVHKLQSEAGISVDQKALSLIAEQSTAETMYHFCEAHLTPEDWAWARLENRRGEHVELVPYERLRTTLFSLHRNLLDQYNRFAPP